MSWQPTASLQTLRHRAQFLQNIRHFFAQRDVIEVDTPLLCKGVATDPFLQAFSIEGRFLQTSPEFPMKRLLASGSGPIYSLGKAFRKAENGARHNPEFTMLEWYRPAWDHWQLIEEVDALFQRLLNCPPATKISYHDLFMQYFDIAPYGATCDELQALSVQAGWVDASFEVQALEKDSWLDLLFTHGIEAQLGQTAPVVILDYPASQASLAKVRHCDKHGHAVAERFEFYYRGMELANGYHELTCAQEQKRRFENDIAKRIALGQESLPLDHALIAALQAGLPESAGVAVGVDRLLMLALNKTQIAEVLPFTWDNA